MGFDDEGLRKVDALLQELECRWDRIFAGLVAGDDVPPSLQLRTEGLMEACVILGISDEAGLGKAMNARYVAATGRMFEEDFGDAWNALYPFPQIPIKTLRAPVYPSTPD